MKTIKIITLSILLLAVVKANSYTDYIAAGDRHYKNLNNFKALEEYEEAYKIAPDNYEVLLKLTRTYNDAGEELKELKRRDEAEDYINKAVKFAEIFKSKYPDSAAVYAYIAFSYGNLAMYVGGKDKIKFAHKIKNNAEKSIKMNPDDYLPYIILGIYHREISDLSWIERAFANTFFGDVPDGSFEESIKMLNTALKLKPNMIVANYQLAKTHRALKNEIKEKELLSQVLKHQVLDFRDKYAKEKAKRRLAEI
ncbi:MAG: hypothetical protein R6W90_00570 [Ignavibacteriaceae bacterium]